MRCLLLLTAALTLGIAPIAHADTYTYTFYGQQSNPIPGQNVPDFETFTVDPSIQVPYPTDGVFDPFAPPCSAPNCFSTPTLNGDFTRQFTRDGAIEDDYSDIGNSVEYLDLFSSSTSTQVLSPFTGPLDNPTLLTGTFFARASFPYLSYSAFGTLTVVDDTLAASAVPEPSTLALLGTGVLGLAGAVRRRLRA